MKFMDALCPCGCLGCGLCRKACPKGAVRWMPPAGARRAPEPAKAGRGLREPGLALGPRGGAKPAVDQDVCLDPETGGCRMECLETCPRKVIVTKPPACLPPEVPEDPSE
jgi:ferredoxin